MECKYCVVAVLLYHAFQFAASGAKVCPRDLDLELLELQNMKPLSLCKALQSVNRNGCFCDFLFSSPHDWPIIARDSCAMRLSLPHSPLCSGLTQLNTRKMMQKASQSEQGNVKPALSSGYSTNFYLSAKQKMLAAGAFFFISCAILCPCLRSKKKSEKPEILGDRNSSYEASSTHERRISSSHCSSSPQTSYFGDVHFSMAQISKATRNFSPSLKVGQGGFGTVYRGHLGNGLEVAVKRAKKDSFKSRLTAEFRNEVEMLAKIEHQNLVKLIGYCEQNNEHILVTEFVTNGTLREHLDGYYGSFLDFTTRIEIAINVAHGLTYLHLYADQQIIHRDVKSSNILLTDNYTAKVADFGFSRAGPLDADETHVTTGVKGTAGYLDPEYLKTYQLTNKSDVYSFGVLLVELFTGRRPIELKNDIDERITIRWAFKKANEGKVVDLLDPKMTRFEGIDNLAEKIFALAFQCIAPTRSDRPTMKQVQELLWEIRSLHYKIMKSSEASN